MDDYNLKMAYEEITNIKLAADGSPRCLCWECTFRLLACTRFQQKALRSHALLARMCNQYENMQQLQTIDRQQHNLISNLVCQYINHNDVKLHETEEAYEDTQEPIQEVNINEVTSDSELHSVQFDLDPETSSDEVLAKQKKQKKCKKKKSEPKIDRRRKPASEVLNDALFSITDLTFEEQIQVIMRRKETANYKNSVFKCEDCFKGFLDEDAYNSHIIRHTDQSGTFVCEVCKTHFKMQHALRNHAASHVQKFSCKCCAYVTTRRHAAKLHEEWHNGTRYKCPHCEEDFVKFSTYMGHIRIKHPSDWVCPLCGHSFVSEKGLRLHKKLKHRFNHQPVDENGPYCQRCDVRFASQAALDQHTKLSPRHDADRKENECRKRGRRVADECDKDGKTRRSRTDKPEGPIPCEQCDMQLPDSLAYYRHFRRTHPDKNRTNYPSMKTKSMCEVCGKMFQSLALLQDHSFTHTDGKLFKCQQCDKSFQRRYRLIAHRRLHSTRPQHACAACGKRFSTASNRTRHMASHTGLKPYKCEMCGKCFKHASEKRAHITYVHLKKPWPKRARGKRRDTKQTPPAPQQQEMELAQPSWCENKMAADKMYLL
ncbi:zinc finger protein 58-like isoform X2 [Cydia pomonella]|nr:zinc finger protein 58-like isoform X2 [Cydia pomonella]